MDLPPNLTLPATLTSGNLNFSPNPLAQPLGCSDGNFILAEEDSSK